MKWLIGFVATVACITAPVLAQDLNERDTKEIGSYRLSEATLAKYSQATAKLGPIVKGVGCTDDDSGEASIAGIVTKLESLPGAKAAVTSAGLATREFVVFTLALVQYTVMAFAVEAGGHLPPGVDAGNVDFVRAHKAAIEALKLGETTGCKEQDERDSREEDANR